MQTTPRLIFNRWSSHCKACKRQIVKGESVWYHGKDDAGRSLGVECTTCKPTDGIETPATDTEQEPPKPYSELPVDELRKLCREKGLVGTRLLSLPKSALVEFLTNGTVPEQQASEPVRTTETPLPLPLNQEKGSIENALASFVAQIAQGVVPQQAASPLDADKLEALVKSEVARLVSKPVVVNLSESKTITIDKDTHEIFPKVLAKLKRHKQVLLVGPAGTGKTTIAQDCSTALAVDYGCISCTAGMSEGHILGRMNAQGDYIVSEFVTLYENGGVFCLDEFDAMDANTALIINTALANGHLPLPNRKDKPSAKRNENFFVVACANTFGTANSIEYTGRNQIDAATLDRFGGGAARFFVDYDTKLEFRLAGQYATELEKLHFMRSKVAENKIRRVISTRAVAAMVAELSAGTKFDEFVSDLTLGWSETERAKVA